MIRHAVRASPIPAELIMVVNNPQLKELVQSKHSSEQVVHCYRKGRGYAFTTGIQHARGDVILLLHVDTVLPSNWSTTIMQVLQNKRCVGGGFSLTFDSSTWFLKLLVLLSRIRFHISGVMFGDRAIFARSTVLRDCLGSMNVPLFEDVRLSQCLRRYGTTVLLRAYVTTSAESFRTKGMWRQVWRIVKCHLWYALGGDLEQIYQYYYSD
jgi:hypothetical protein